MLLRNDVVVNGAQLISIVILTKHVAASSFSKHQGSVPGIVFVSGELFYEDYSLNISQLGKSLSSEARLEGFRSLDFNRTHM